MPTGRWSPATCSHLDVSHELTAHLAPVDLVGAVLLVVERREPAGRRRRHPDAYMSMDSGLAGQAKLARPTSEALSLECGHRREVFAP